MSEKFGFHQWFECLAMLEEAIVTLECTDSFVKVRKGIDIVEAVSHHIRVGLGIEVEIVPDVVELLRVAKVIEEVLSSQEEDLAEFIDGVERYFVVEPWETVWARKLSKEVQQDLKKWIDLAGDNRRKKPESLLEQMIEKIRARVKKHD
jgi:DNA-binding ferritin-like protein (Dps family)